MNKTPNYSLNQWEADDRVLRTDFNADNTKIDAALSALAENKGNCEILFGTYTGNGKSLEKEPLTLTFPKKPMLVLVADGISIMIASRGGGAGARVGSGSGQSNTLTWGERSVSWTAHDNYGAHMNLENTVYYYIAFVEA